MKKHNKILVLCSDDYHHKYLLNVLGLNFDISAIVIEPTKNQRDRYLSNKKYVDYFYFWYHIIRRKFLGWDIYRKKYFHILNEEPVKGCIPISVNNINQKEVYDLLEKIKPDITIVMGTSILSKKTLSLTGITINIHGGILPYYRGNNCFFFALYNFDFDKLGSTIHYINNGIDTGDIIEIIYVQYTKNDNPETLYSRAEKIAIHKLVGWIQEIQKGNIPLGIKQNTSEGHTYKNRDRKIYHDLLYYLTKKIVLK